MMRMYTILRQSSSIIQRTIGDDAIIIPNADINKDVVRHQNYTEANGAVISHKTIIEGNVLISAGVTFEVTQ